MFVVMNSTLGLGREGERLLYGSRQNKDQTIPHDHTSIKRTQGLQQKYMSHIYLLDIVILHLFIQHFLMIYCVDCLLSTPTTHDIYTALYQVLGGRRRLHHTFRLKEIPMIQSNAQIPLLHRNNIEIHYIIICNLLTGKQQMYVTYFVPFSKLPLFSIIFGLR